MSDRHLLRAEEWTAYWRLIRLPNIDKLRELVGLLRYETSSAQQDARQRRVGARSHAMNKDWETSKRTVFAWCKEENAARVVMVQRDDGSLTANAAEVHELLLKHWMPIFRMYESQEEPDVNAFLNHFGQFCKPMEEFVVPKLTGQRILEVLRKMKNSSCPGLDGWRVAELRALPLQLLDLLADIFNVIEETGV